MDPLDEIAARLLATTAGRLLAMPPAARAETVQRLRHTAEDLAGTPDAITGGGHLIDYHGAGHVVLIVEEDGEQSVLRATIGAPNAGEVYDLDATDEDLAALREAGVL